MSRDLQKRISRLAADRESGASVILAEVMALLSEALEGRADVAATARAVCRAQPSMAPVWNAAIEALASVEEPGRFARFAQRVARAQAALSRFAIACLALHGSGGRAPSEGELADSALRVATISFSGTVLTVLAAVARERPLHVWCSESRPALEGRTLAARLAQVGVPVTVLSDAGLGHALPTVDAVVVGADAVAPQFFLNKSGTGMLAAAAMLQGVPTYVLAAREKFVSAPVASRLVGREGPADEVWDSPPAGVLVRNPYFEATPLEHVASVVTDAGELGAASVPAVCEATAHPRAAVLLQHI